MNKYFDINRFGKYFLYELKRAYSNCFLSVLICVCMPAIMFAFVELFTLIFYGHASEAPADAFYALTAGIASLAVLIIALPSKLFGQLTDKRFGSDWLMIPASTLEKWLGVIAMSCVVLPVGGGILFLGIDGLMSLVFGQYYGYSLLHNIGELQNLISLTTNSVLNINLGGMLYVKVAEYILIFTLGAICFKTAKPAKTILTLIIISSVFGFFLGGLGVAFGSNLIDIIQNWAENFESRFAEIDPVTAASKVAMYINLALSLWYLLICGGLMGGIYYRIKTLKH